MTHPKDLAPMVAVANTIDGAGIVTQSVVRLDLLDLKAIDKSGFIGVATAFTPETEKRQADIPEGHTFIVTGGSYSAYSVYGVFKALKTIPLTELRVTWGRDRYGRYMCDTFIAWLEAEGYCEQVPALEMYLGDGDKDADDWQVKDV